MTHSDDNGLVLPPNLAPHQVVIVPIYRGEEQMKEVLKVAEKIKSELINNNIRVKLDNRDNFKPGFKFNEYELKGVPLRIAIGPKDIENRNVEVARRDDFSKNIVSQNELPKYIKNQLIDIQKTLFDRAKKFQKDNITTVDSFEDFKDVLNKKGGFILAHWDGTEVTENAIKNETKATIRCIPLENKKETGTCVYSGKPSKGRVFFAKAYWSIF